MHDKELPSTLKLVIIWLLIFGALALGWQAFEHQRQQSQFKIDGAHIELKRGPDGHFHWPGHINGVAVDFLVDTGATSTAVPKALAEQAGLQPERQVRSDTAGGVVRGYVARADLSLKGGVSAERLPVTVLPALSGPLLGMDVLSKLHFRQEDGRFIVNAN